MLTLWEGEDVTTASWEPTSKFSTSGLKALQLDTTSFYSSTTPSASPSHATGLSALIQAADVELSPIGKPRCMDLVAAVAEQLIVVARAHDQAPALEPEEDPEVGKQF